MIRIFKSTEKEFLTLGLGVLGDAISCKVTNELNGKYELEMEYPITGQHYDDIQLDRIIYCRPDRFSDEEPFRIYSITRPIEGKIKIKAQHLSYDMNYYPCTSFSAENLADALKEAENSIVGDCPFKIVNKFSENPSKEFSNETVRNFRGLFYSGKSGNSSSNTITDVYECDLLPKKYTLEVYPKGQLGKNRGVRIEYGKNMVDVEKTSNTNTKYTGVFPFFSQNVSNQDNETTYLDYQKYYVIPNTEPYSKDWLSISAGPDYHAPLLHLKDDLAIRVVSDDSYNGKVVIWDGNNKCYVDVTDHADDYEKYYPDTAIKYGDSSYETITLVDAEDNGIVYVPGKEKDEYQKILVLDLSGEDFGDSTPTKDQIREKAKKYITDNKIGEEEISLSTKFILLSETNEYKDILKNEKILLGDRVNVIYYALGVSDTLRVQGIEYDVVQDKYDNITLGEREPLLSSVILRKNDKTSYLKNDSGYVSIPKVTNVVEEAANNSFLSGPQITNLEVCKFNCPGIIEGSQDAIDTLVAGLLIADDAIIKGTLTAGEIEVKGTITATNGEFLGVVNVTGNYQSTINNFHSENSQIENLVSDDSDFNTVRLKELTFKSGQDSPETITVGTLKEEYYRYPSLDELYQGTQYYGWYKTEPETDPSYLKFNEILTAVIDPDELPGAVVYYASDKSFYTIVEEYIPSQRIDTNMSLESVSGSSSVTMAYFLPDNVVKSYRKSTSDNSIYVDISAIATSNNSGTPDPCYLPDNTNVTVSFRLTCQNTSGTYIDFEQDAACLIVSGSYQSETVRIKIPNPRNGLDPTSLVITSVSPENKSYEVITPGSTLMSIDNHFAPKTRDKYSLGYSGREWKDIYAMNSSILTSDKRKKTDISYDIEKYDELFDKLKPASFKLKYGTSGRTHLGFIAQDVKESMNELGIGSKDLAMFVKSLPDPTNTSPTESDYEYALRYGELHALEVRKIQMLEKRIDELERIISKYEGENQNG